MWDSRFLISGFCDEICRDKRLETQLAVCSALGMEFVTLRFLDVGQGVKNVVALTDEEVVCARRMLDDYSLAVSSIGSPIGKIKLNDFVDSTANRFVPPDEYLATEVSRTCEIAKLFNCKLVRGFSFYHPAGTDPRKHVEAAAGRLREIVQVCDASDLTFGLEVEANLIGQNGEILRDIVALVNHPGLVLVFDGANLVTQGYDTESVHEQWMMMRDHVGWIHAKDYLTTESGGAVGGHIDEESLARFVPTGAGASGYDRILADAWSRLPEIQLRMEKRGVPGLFIDLEPHLAGGGQFGGYSGAGGFGKGFRSLCQLLDSAGIGYRLRG